MTTSPKRTITALGLALVGSVAACSLPNHSPASARKEAASKELSIAVLDCGNVTVNDVSILTPGHGAGERKKLIDTCFLVEHPEGRLLWNTGLSDALGPEPITVFEGAFDLSVTRPLLPQLAELGVAPKDIDYLALSHFHDDHTGNANAFAGATLLIQREEFDAAFGDSPEVYGFDGSTYAELDPDDARVLSGETDVFGDGRLRILPAPGHSPGHQVLFVDLEESGPIVLSGDLYHFAAAREMRSVPSFNSDPEASRASMERIEGFLAETGSTLWIQHDFEQMSQLKRAPHRYR